VECWGLLAVMSVGEPSCVCVRVCVRVWVSNDRSTMAYGYIEVKYRADYNNNPPNSISHVRVHPRTADFYHNRTSSILQQLKRNFWKIAEALFRISTMTNSFKYTPKLLSCPWEQRDPWGTCRCFSEPSGSWVSKGLWPLRDGGGLTFSGNLRVRY
jgi:hypothetical protein